MNNTIFAARKASPLVRLWRSTSEPGTPLVCNWVRAETVKLRSDSMTDETGGLRRCV
jgi:hypothetical protein